VKCVQECDEKHCKHRKVHEVEVYRDRNSYDKDCMMEIGKCFGCSPVVEPDRKAKNQ